MRDEKHGQVEFLLQILQQVQDLRLHRYVQGGHRFVGHDDAGMRSQGPGDADALPLAAGKGVRIANQRLDAEADQFRQMAYARLDFAGGTHAVGAQRLRDDVQNGLARIERGVRVLENHLHEAAPGAQRFLAQLHQIRQFVSVQSQVDAPRCRFDGAQDAAP